MSLVGIILVILILMAFGWGGYGGGRVYGPDFNGGYSIGFGGFLLIVLMALLLAGRL